MEQDGWYIYSLNYLIVIYPNWMTIATVLGVMVAQPVLYMQHAAIWQPNVHKSLCWQLRLLYPILLVYVKKYHLGHSQKFSTASILLAFILLCFLCNLWAHTVAVSVPTVGFVARSYFGYPITRAHLQHRFASEFVESNPSNRATNFSIFSCKCVHECSQLPVKWGG